MTAWLKYRGINPSSVHDPKNGWYVLAEHHTSAGGLHADAHRPGDPKGEVSNWEKDWKKFRKENKDLRGAELQAKLDEQVELMKKKYGLIDANGKVILGKPVPAADNIPYKIWKKGPKAVAKWRAKQTPKAKGWNASKAEKADAAARFKERTGHDYKPKKKAAQASPSKSAKAKAPAPTSGTGKTPAAPTPSNLSTRKSSVIKGRAGRAAGAAILAAGIYRFLAGEPVYAATGETVSVPEGMQPLNSLQHAIHTGEKLAGWAGIVSMFAEGGGLLSQGGGWAATKLPIIGSKLPAIGSTLSGWAPALKTGGKALGAVTTVVQTAVTVGDMVEHWSRGDFVSVNEKHGKRLRDLFDEQKWKENPVAQSLDAVGQFFDPVSTLAGTADNVVKTIEIAQDLPRAYRDRDESTRRVERLQAEYEANVKPRLLNQMEREAQEQARRDVDQTREIIAGIEERIQLEREMRDRIVKERQGRWFRTGDLDSQISHIDRSLEERQQALERNKRALEMALAK